MSECRKQVVDESISCNLNGFEGFESDAVESNDSGLSEVEVTYVQQKNIVNRILPQYIDQIVSNLSDIFDEQGIVFLFKIFVPSCIVSAEKESSQVFLKFGLEELDHLLDKFETSLSIERETCVSEYAV